MKNFISTLLILTVSALILTGCLTKDEEPVVRNDKFDGVELLIHVNHFKGEKCQQKVSPKVYEMIREEDRGDFISDPEYVRHHSLELMKMGRCDNTVILYSEKSKEYIYVCGGHTSAER